MILGTLSNRTRSRRRGQEDAAAKLFKLSQPRFHLNGNLPVDVTVASPRPPLLA